MMQWRRALIQRLNLNHPKAPASSVAFSVASPRQCLHESPECPITARQRKRSVCRPT